MQKYKQLYALFNSLEEYRQEHPSNFLELSATAMRMELQKQYKKLVEIPSTEATTEPPPPPPEEP